MFSQSGVADFLSKISGEEKSLRCAHKLLKLYALIFRVSVL
jgi:hypothetical protein